MVAIASHALLKVYKCLFESIQNSYLKHKCTVILIYFVHYHIGAIHTMFIAKCNYQPADMHEPCLNVLSSFKQKSPLLLFQIQYDKAHALKLIGLLLHFYNAFSMQSIVSYN